MRISIRVFQNVDEALVASHAISEAIGMPEHESQEWPGTRMTCARRSQFSQPRRCPPMVVSARWVSTSGKAEISLCLALPIVRVFGMGSPPSRLRRFGAAAFAWLAEPKLAVGERRLVD